MKDNLIIFGMLLVSMLIGYLYGRDKSSEIIQLDAQTKRKFQEQADQILTIENQEEYDHVLEFLDNTYIGARMSDDLGMMVRVARAIAAFKCDDNYDESEYPM